MSVFTVAYFLGRDTVVGADDVDDADAGARDATFGRFTLVHRHPPIYLKVQPLRREQRSERTERKIEKVETFEKDR